MPQRVCKTGKGERNRFLLCQNICSLISMPRFCKALPAGTGPSTGNVEGCLRKCPPWTNDVPSPAWGRRWTQQHGGTRPSQRTMPGPRAPPRICTQPSSHVSLPSGLHTGENTYSGVISPFMPIPWTLSSKEIRWAQLCTWWISACCFSKADCLGCTDHALKFCSFPSNTSQSHRRD